MKKNIFFILLFSFFSLNSCKSPAVENLVTIETDYGKIEVVLSDETPKHRDNFLKLAKEGFYNGTLFHRCIQGFMIQGGDPTSKASPAGSLLGSGDIGYKIPAEIKLPHYRGALAAARDQNPEKQSSGSQFYIVQGTAIEEAMLTQVSQMRGFQYTLEQIAEYKKTGGTPMLDGEYTVFGQVVSGMDVVDKIAALPRDANDRPQQDVKMSVSLK